MFAFTNLANIKLYRIHAILGTPPERVLNRFYQYRNRQIPWEFPEVRIGQFVTSCVQSVIFSEVVVVLKEE